MFTTISHPLGRHFLPTKRATMNKSFRIHTTYSSLINKHKGGPVTLGSDVLGGHMFLGPAV